MPINVQLSTQGPHHRLVWLLDFCKLRDSGTVAATVSASLRQAAHNGTLTSARDYAVFGTYDICVE